MSARGRVPVTVAVTLPSSHRAVTASKSASAHSTARGTTTVSPRAIERAVECALADFDAVTARWEDGTVTATVTATRPRALTGALAAAPGAITRALQSHGLPEAEVQVVLRRVRPSSNREVS